MSYLKEEERYVGCAVFLLLVDIKFIFLWVGLRPITRPDPWVAKKEGEERYCFS